VVSCLRNDEDYRVQEEGKVYFINAGYRHVDVRDYQKADIQRLIHDVVETVPVPLKPGEEAPKNFQIARPGDVVFDIEWLGEYLSLLEKEER